MPGQEGGREGGGDDHKDEGSIRRFVRPGVDDGSHRHVHTGADPGGVKQCRHRVVGLPQIRRAQARRKEGASFDIKFGVQSCSIKKSPVPIGARDFFVRNFTELSP